MKNLAILGMFCAWKVPTLANTRMVGLILFLLLPTVSNAQDCETGHWIQEVSGGGKLVKLEDGSLWKVSSIDVITSALWLPTSDISICSDTMINADDDESVEVTRVSGTPDQASSAKSSQKDGYLIEAVVNDEVFVINGQTYEAKTYCFGFDEGDRVEFINGSTFGACASAEILHLGSGKTCRLWCE